MDFVARAGAIIDRAHRIAGVLLICVVVLGAVTTCQWTRNTALNAQLMDARVRLPVIVVPGATIGLYSPTEDDRLIYMFTEQITQLFNSFTAETLPKQYELAKQFFAPAMQIDSAPYFEKKIRDSTADRRSSLFVPDRASYKVRKYQDNGVEMRDVSMTGQLSTIVAGTVAESIIIQLDMTFQKGTVSPANPYGLLLTSYHETPITVADKTPKVLPADANVQFTPPPEAQQGPAAPVPTTPPAQQ